MLDPVILLTLEDRKNDLRTMLSVQRKVGGVD